MASTLPPLFLSVAAATRILLSPLLAPTRPIHAGMWMLCVVWQSTALSSYRHAGQPSLPQGQPPQPPRVAAAAAMRQQQPPRVAAVAAMRQMGPLLAPSFLVGGQAEAAAAVAARAAAAEGVAAEVVPSLAPATNMAAAVLPRRRQRRLRCCRRIHSRPSSRGYFLMCVRTCAWVC